MRFLDLNDGWELRQEELYTGPEKHEKVMSAAEGWLGTKLPCDIHMALIDHGQIREPLEANNALDCEWTEHKSWWFRSTFRPDDDLYNREVIEIIFESLDSMADIFLNGVHLGRQRSSFYPFRKNIKPWIRPGDNTLLVRLTSGLEHFSAADASPNAVITIPQMNNLSDPRRVFVRKSQFVYGWDWAPRIPTCGIVKDVWLEAYDHAAIRIVHARTDAVRFTGGSGLEQADADLKFAVELENFHGQSTCEARLELSLHYGSDTIWSSMVDLAIPSGTYYADFACRVDNAHLWWPNGMGEQSLYTVRTRLIVGKAVHKYPEFQVGIRTLRLNREKITDSSHADERMFQIVVNDKPVHCKGANWIPADSIYARVTSEKYEALLEEAACANLNMLRVWGGGIYEYEEFYRKCNEKGILIWHDFMFSWGLYPDHLQWFKEDVEIEIDYQTRRLRNHPSMALWCGNNENHWGFAEYFVKDKEPPYAGGIDIYNKIAPRLVRKNCPDTPYWNSSPYGGAHPNSEESGCRHHWYDCTMHPEMDNRVTPERYDNVRAKFISEYGYIGPCKKSTIEAYHAGQPIDRAGEIWKIHNNANEKATVPAGIRKHYIEPDNLDLDDYLLYAGMCQGLMLGYSLEAIRSKANCSGSLFWMYNDCWGEVGWTIIDYYVRRKISYYFVKRAFSPIKLIAREVNGIIQVTGINDTPHEFRCTVDYGYTRFEGSIPRELHQAHVTLPSFSKTIVLEFDKGDDDLLHGLLYVRPASDKLDTAIYRSGPFRDLAVPAATPVVDNFQVQNGVVTVTVSSSTYAHGVHFGLDDNALLSDEYFDLLPGSQKQITITNLTGPVTPDRIRPLCINHSTRGF